MKKILIAAALVAFSLPVVAQQQSPPMSQGDTIEVLRSMLDAYKALVTEANERVATYKAQSDLVAAKNKNLEAEIEKLNGSKAEEPAKTPAPK